MFSSTKLFSAISCPYGAKCELRHCGFKHDSVREPQKTDQSSSTVVQSDTPAKGLESLSKKRKLDDDHGKATPRPRLQESLQYPLPAKPSTAVKPNASQRTTSQPHQKPVPALKRPAAPAPLDSNGASRLAQRAAPAAVKKKPTKAEALMPRIMGQPPAQFKLRFQLLKLMHEQVTRLNKEMQASKDPDRAALVLTEQECIKEALDVEEELAQGNAQVYANVAKLRIVAMKKMKLDEWKKERLKQIARDHPQPTKQPSRLPGKVETGLSANDEIALLPSLVTPIGELGAFGYIPQPPTDDEIAQARAGVEAAKCWERCDRCDSRFQVFPGRREDGMLTTNGPCTYHYGRKRRPPKQPGDSAPRDDLWTCCRGEMGSKGCTRHESHVFKISDAKRLSLVMPFEATHTKSSQPSKTAVAFDCEMGYTSMGMELIRLTATAWPSGEELIDVLVRPLGEILDLNSRFSGVWPDDFTNAVAYDSSTAEDKKDSDDGEVRTKRLRIVDSPQRARAILQERLTTNTPLIGHAIDNDLNAVRICHPIIVDTVLLFPHPQGLPYRFGLKALAKRYLDLDVQTGGEAGHDSKEDAQATGELVRFQVAEKWKEMQREGWKIEQGVFIPPKPKD